MKRRTLFILLGLIALIVILAVVFGGRREEGTRIFTTEVEKRAIQEKVAASGKVFPQTEVKISSDVSGEIVELYVEEGDSVVAGQLLAKIDADTYQSQVARGEAGVNSAKANEANAKAQIKTLEASKEQIQAQLKNAQEIYDRNLKLREEGVISQADLEASLSSLDALKANFRSAESNIQAARESAKAAQYQVKSSAATLEELRTSLRRTTIYAPMGGVISLLSVEQGERVVGTIQMTGTEMMRIANLNAMEVRVEVSENDVPRVSLGDKAEIEIDAYLDRKFIGTVTQVANSSTTAATAENVLNSDQVTNFEVRISIDPESYADLIAGGNPYPFRPGMSAGADILTEKVNEVLTVPIQCVSTRENEDYKDNPELEELLEVVF
ncbi:MAG: efflux RND transporter periplasmic adaptor subunit, partial [Bacteroidota bacterium]